MCYFPGVTEAAVAGTAAAGAGAAAAGPIIAPVVITETALAAPAFAAAGTAAAGTAAGTAAASGLTTWQSLSLASSALGAAMSAYSLNQQGQGQANMYDYQSAIDRNNAIAYGYQSDAVRARGEIDKERLERLQALNLGKQKAGWGASNLDMSSGTPAEALSAQEEQDALDQAIFTYNLDMDTYLAKIGQQSQMAGASLQTMAARNSRKTGAGQGFGTLISGAATVADKWQSYRV